MSYYSEGFVAAHMIAAERRRQIEAEGWTSEWDRHHLGEELARAAACYAFPYWMRPMHRVGEFQVTVPAYWPWAPKYWKPCKEDRVKELVKAGSLIAAEIDRILLEKSLDREREING